MADDVLSLPCTKLSQIETRFIKHIDNQVFQECRSRIYLQCLESGVIPPLMRLLMCLKRGSPVSSAASQETERMEALRQVTCSDYACNSKSDALMVNFFFLSDRCTPSGVWSSPEMS